MILIDPIRRYPRGPFGHLDWCHMMTDNLSLDGLADLHEMARAIGIPRHAFQWHHRFPHYDLTPARRQLALVHGAVEVTAKELVRRCRRDGGAVTNVSPVPARQDERRPSLEASQLERKVG